MSKATQITKTAALVATLSSFACAGAQPPQPAIQQFDEAALDAYLAALESDDPARTSDGVTQEAIYLEMIDDAAKMPKARRTPFVARTLADLASHRLEQGDIPGALRAGERAANESRGDAALTASVDRVRLEVYRAAALDAVRRGQKARGLALFERAMTLTGLSRSQRERLAGDRYVALAQHDITEPAKPRPKKIMQRPRSRRAASGAPIPASAALTVVPATPLAADLPDATLPAPTGAPVTETGRFDQGLVQQVVAENKVAIAACYNRALKSGRSRRGKLELRVTIEPTGVVSSASVTNRRFRNTEVARCISETVQRWRFPPFEGRARQADLPFVLDHL